MNQDILTPMNHREIEYNARKLSECNISDSFLCAWMEEKCAALPDGDNLSALLKWLDETGKRVFDDDLVMDYGTDCLRLYLLFEKTPSEKDAPYYDSWQEGALEGIYKFLGRYRRMILVADEWNRRGNYNEGTLPGEAVGRLNHALENAHTKIRDCISRGNTMPNRHNIVSAMMGLLNIYQKELRIGEIVVSLHTHAIEAAVPHGDKALEAAADQMEADRRNPAVTELCRDFMILMMPYAPALSRVLWSSIYGAC